MYPVPAEEYLLWLLDAFSNQTVSYDWSKCDESKAESLLWGCAGDEGRQLLDISQVGQG